MVTPGGARYRGPDRRAAPSGPARPVPVVAALAGIGLTAVTGVTAGAAPISGPVGRDADPMVATAAATLWVLAGAVRVVRSRVAGDVRSLRLGLAACAAGLAGAGPLVAAAGTATPTAAIDAAAVGLLAATAALLVTAALGPEIDTGVGLAGALTVPTVVGVAVAGPALAPGTVPYLSAAVVGVLGAAAAGVAVVGFRRRAPALGWAGIGLSGLTVGTIAGAAPAAIGALVVLASGLGDLAGPYRTQREVNLAAQRRVVAFRRDLEVREAAWAEQAHDVRSALLAVQGATRALGRRAGALTEDERSRLAAAIDAEFDRVRALVGGRDDGAVRPVRLAALLEPLVACRRAAGLDVTVAVPPDLVVLARPSAVREVVANLLDNAARHAPGTPVEVTATATPGDVRVLVTDGGPGVPRDRRARIFERGFSTRPEPGAGLGLHVARSLARAGGGDLWVQDGPDGGAAFVLALPSAAGLGRRRVPGGAEQLEGASQETDLAALDLDHAVSGPGRGPHP